MKLITHMHYMYMITQVHDCGVIRVVVVGVNTSVDDAELLALASQVNYYIPIEDYALLPGSFETIALAVCEPISKATRAVGTSTMVVAILCSCLIVPDVLIAVKDRL